MIWLLILLACCVSFTAGLFVESWDAKRPHRTRGRCTVCGRYGDTYGHGGPHLAHEGARGFLCSGDPSDRFACAGCRANGTQT